ncbi:MAG: response regulator transcription factor [Chloroflexi bacterium]|nr:response regulator transcription factor [Chloroflexota bacterium]
MAAVRAVLRGEVYVHPSMTRVLLDDMLADSPGENVWDTLSEREQIVLKLVVLGHTGAEIGERLNLGIKTVDTYRMRGMEKLGLTNRAALVRFALKKGLISAD